MSQSVLFGVARAFSSSRYQKVLFLARELQASQQEQPAMLAVPLHGEDVAPRFCAAHEFVIAELDGGRVLRTFRLTLSEEAWSRRLERLSATGVKVLLCGGFNRDFLPRAEALGIRVISGLAGEAERLIDAFARGEIEQYRFLPCRGRRKGRHGGRWQRQSHGRELRGGKGVESCPDTTRLVRWEPDRSRDEAWVAAADPTTERQE
jgi:predicted Fe-Mo cluster-binding NifX family protein